MTHRFAGSNEYMPITPDEKIVGVDHEGKHVALRIQSTVESGFKYTVLMDCTSQPFFIVPFLGRIQDSLFESMKKDIAK